MDIEVFIGDLNDPEFDYEKGSWSGNIPKQISGYFPKPQDIYLKIIDKIEQKELIGRQTDWGSWTAIVYPDDLKKLIIEIYGESACESDSRLGSLLTFVRQLERKKQYGLVVCEMA